MQVSQLHRMGIEDGSQEFHYFLESFLEGEAGEAPEGWEAALARGETLLRWNSSLQPFKHLPQSSQVFFIKKRSYTFFVRVSKSV